MRDQDGRTRRCRGGKGGGAKFLTWRDSCATRGLLLMRLTSRGSGAGVTAPALSFPHIAGLLSPRLSCLRMVSEIVLGSQIDLSLMHFPRFGGEVSQQPAQFLGPWTNRSPPWGSSVDRVDFYLERTRRGAWQGLPELPGATRRESPIGGEAKLRTKRAPQVRHREARAAGRLTQHSPNFLRWFQPPRVTASQIQDPPVGPRSAKLTGGTLGGYEATLVLALQGHIPRRLGGHLPWNIRATAAVESDKVKVAQSHDARQSNLTGRYKAGTDPAGSVLA
jgi:hypothetical protein